MILGKNEKKILLRLIPSQFTPPSVYLEVFNSCPSSNKSLMRIVDKGLAVFRWEIITPEQRKRNNAVLRPGYESADYYGALKPTPLGEQVIYDLWKKECPF